MEDTKLSRAEEAAVKPVRWIHTQLTAELEQKQRTIEQLQAAVRQLRLEVKTCRARLDEVRESTTAVVDHLNEPIPPAEGH